MSFEIDVQFADASLAQPPTPSTDDLSKWATSVLARQGHNGGISIRITDEQEIATLNQTYRQKQGPTNVLSFPMELPEEIEEPLLGDIVICAPVVEREANQQGKPLSAHWAHMVVHGVLHLLGYDHINDQDAEEMEALEIKIMQQLGYENPYKTMEEQ